MPGPRIALVQRDTAEWVERVRTAGFDLRRFSGPDALFQPSCPAFGLFVLGDFAGGTAAAIDAAWKLKRISPFIPILLIATESSEETAIAALRAGVSDYLRSPLTSDQVYGAVLGLLGVPRTSGPSAVGRRQLIYQSTSMRSVVGYATKLSLSNSTVLITGETGTGKELVAEMIHGGSPRNKKPLVAINCAAIPDALLEGELFGRERGAYTGADTSYEGKLKLADGGTVFFDEIGDLTACGQAKLLRVLESRQVQRLGSAVEVPLNIRVVAATNQELAGMVERGLFRRDLYFRLSVARVEIPPLRARKDDIPYLLDYFVGAFQAEQPLRFPGFAASALRALTAYDWPGNVRQLRNVVEELFARLPDRPIEALDLSPEITGIDNREVAEDGDEKTRIMTALTATHWNKKRAAERLCWSRMTLYRKLAFYGIFEPGHPSAEQIPASAD
jgi:DNA-binding NtrC family response regulator